MSIVTQFWSMPSCYGSLGSRYLLKFHSSCLVFSHLQVDDLKDLLAAQEVELAQKNADANELIQIVGAESEKVGKEKAIADAEEAKVSKIKAMVEVKAADCSRDLAKAEPALLAAEGALNTLNKVLCFL